MDLRQKAINLIYIILLAMLFNYVPANYMEGLEKSELGINSIKSQLERLGLENRMLALDEMSSRQPMVYEEVKATLKEIDQYAGEIQVEIQESKIMLLETLPKGKKQRSQLLNSELVMNNLLIESGQATYLLDKLRRFKQKIKATIRADYVDEIDSILPTPGKIKKSNGTWVSFEEYYFEGKPLSVSLLNLSLFAVRVEQIRNYADRATRAVPDKMLLADLGSNNATNIMNSTSQDYATFIFRNGDSLGVEKLQQLRRVGFYHSPVNSNVEFHIGLKLRGGLGETRYIRNVGDQLNKEVRSIFSLAKPGDLLDISDIQSGGNRIESVQVHLK